MRTLHILTGSQGFEVFSHVASCRRWSPVRLNFMGSLHDFATYSVVSSKRDTIKKKRRSATSGF